MSEKDKIITEYLKGSSKSEIARMTKRSRKTVRKYIPPHDSVPFAEFISSRKTVRKYINEYLEKQKCLDEARTEEEKEAIIIESSKKPTYNTSNRKRLKITPEVEEIINDCLDKNEFKRKSGNRKLEMKRVDIHEHLIKLGHDISYRAVCSYVGTRIEKKKVGKIKLLKW